MKCYNHPDREAVDAFKKSPSLYGLRNFENAYPNSDYKATVYDTYALYLCDQINIQSCKKSDFKEAMSYAQTQNTKNKISAKEQQWKNLKSSNSARKAGAIVGGVLLGGAVVAGIIVRAAKEAEEN